MRPAPQLMSGKMPTQVRRCSVVRDLGWSAGEEAHGTGTKATVAGKGRCTQVQWGAWQDLVQARKVASAGTVLVPTGDLCLCWEGEKKCQLLSSYSGPPASIPVCRTMLWNEQIALPPVCPGIFQTAGSKLDLQGLILCCLVRAETPLPNALQVLPEPSPLMFLKF